MDPEKLTDQEKEILKLQDRFIRYASFFNSEDGRFVLEDLRKTANRPSYEPGMKDPVHEPYYREGQRSILLLIDATAEEGRRIIEATQAGATPQTQQVQAILDDIEEE